MPYSSDESLFPTHCTIGWDTGRSRPSMCCTVCQWEELVTVAPHGIASWQAYMTEWQCRPQTSEQILRHALATAPACAG
jgi:hypothetical protein